MFWGVDRFAPHQSQLLGQHASLPDEVNLKSFTVVPGPWIFSRFPKSPVSHRCFSKACSMSCSKGKFSLVNIISLIQWAPFTDMRKENRDRSWATSNDILGSVPVALVKHWIIYYCPSHVKEIWSLLSETYTPRRFFINLLEDEALLPERFCKSIRVKQ